MRRKEVSTFPQDSTFLQRCKYNEERILIGWKAPSPNKASIASEALDSPDSNGRRSLPKSHTTATLQRFAVVLKFKDVSSLGELRVKRPYAFPTNGIIRAANTAAICMTF